jgi:hypothetical protein
MNIKHYNIKDKWIRGMNTVRIKSVARYQKTKRLSIILKVRLATS